MAWTKKEIVKSELKLDHLGSRLIIGIVSEVEWRTFAGEVVFVRSRENGGIAEISWRSGQRGGPGGILLAGGAGRDMLSIRVPPGWTSRESR